MLIDVYTTKIPGLGSSFNFSAEQAIEGYKKGLQWRLQTFDVWNHQEHLEIVVGLDEVLMKRAWKTDISWEPITAFDYWTFFATF